MGIDFTRAFRLSKELRDPKDESEGFVLNQRLEVA
jgi:hypothetical protein